MDGLILPLLLMLVVALPLVLSTRKQKRMMAEQQEMQNSLSDGDRVMTTSGLYATVADASDDTTIDLEIADGVVTTWLRQAVRERIVPEGDDATGVEEVSDAENGVEALDSSSTETAESLSGEKTDVKEASVAQSSDSSTK